MSKKILVKKLTNKTISLKNRLEDMKSLYEDIIIEEKDNFMNVNVFEFKLNNNEKIQIIKWRAKLLLVFYFYFNK